MITALPQAQAARVNLILQLVAAAAQQVRLDGAFHPGRAAVVRLGPVDGLAAAQRGEQFGLVDLRVTGSGGIHAGRPSGE